MRVSPTVTTTERKRTRKQAAFPGPAGFLLCLVFFGFGPPEHFLSVRISLKSNTVLHHVFFKTSHRLCVYGYGGFLSLDDGHEHSVSCLGVQHVACGQCM